MTEQIIVKWWNSELQIGLLSIKKAVALVNGDVIYLIAEDYRGSLYFRFPRTDRRISYVKIKSGIDQRNKTIQVYMPF